MLMLLALPFVIHIIAIRYVPLAGWALAFFNYKPGKALDKLPFVGLKYFELIGFYKEDVINAVINTGALSGLGVLFSWFPMFLAMLLNEVRNRYWKNGIQTVITIPNFVSWVIVYALCFSIFSTEGLYNQLFHTNNTLLTNKDTIWYFMEGLTLWKSAGWNSIIYLAAIAGIDESLYEAAMVDGANRFQSALHITLPSLMSTFIVVLLLQIGSFMSAGFDQIFCVFQHHGAIQAGSDRPVYLPHWHEDHGLFLRNGHQHPTVHRIGRAAHVGERILPADKRGGHNMIQSRSPGSKISYGLIYLFLAAFTLLCAYPFYYLIIYTFSDSARQPRAFRLSQGIYLTTSRWFSPWIPFRGPWG